LGVSATSLYAWVNESNRSGKHVGKSSHTSRRPQDWSAAEKFEAVLESSQLSDEELGRYLREKGIHEANLKEWRKQAEKGLSPAPMGADKQLVKENKRLNKELQRKERALAEAAALLVLSKKARALWGEEGENT